MKRRAIAAWCLYDAALTAGHAVIDTFIFSVYFTRSVAESPVAGTAQWSQAIAAAGLMIALLSPLLGAIADRSGRRKPWIAGFSLLCIGATTALWWVRPDPAWVPLALVAAATATVGRELAQMFYNAMLPGLARPGQVGRLSGWGWACGYLGGLGCLLLALHLLVQAPAPLFGLLATTDAAPVRAVAPLAALWFALLGLPMFFLTPDQPATGVPLGRAAAGGLAGVWRTLRELRRHRPMLRFLIASALYRDGLATLVTFGGIYAAGTFGMSFAQIVWFAIALNVTAAAGAFGFAWIDDAIGARRTILITLAGLMGLGTAVLLVREQSSFWWLAVGLGTFVGPAQAAGRSLLARMAPPEMVTEMFGLYNLTGKAAAFMGPLALGLATDWFQSQRAGMATIVGFFLAGFILMLGVREPPAPVA